MFDNLLNAPYWWRGLTRAERAAGPDSITDEQRDYGRRRREAWRGGYIMPGKDVSLERWERLGVTEERLVELLGEPVEALAARIPARPPWLDVVADAWRRFGSSRIEDLGFGRPAAEAHQHRDSHDRDHHSHDHDSHQDECASHDQAANVMFLQTIAPLLAWARADLVDRVTVLAARHGYDERLPADHPLLRPPVDRLMSIIIPTMILEVNVARVEGRLTGETPGQRMASFVGQLREPKRMLGFLAEYPVLAREVVRCLQTAVEVRAGFLERFLTDLPRLREAFGGTWQGPADLADVNFGAGDTHRGGQTVAILTFADGRKVVYKPRNLGVEVHFNRLLGWLNANGLRHPLRPLVVLDRGGYGWTDHVAVASCQDEEEVEHFFWRQGAYLALLYALCSSDMHLENVIAAGEHPVIVDLEAIFQVSPRVTGEQSLPHIRGEAPRVVRDSVLRIGLLPERIITAGDDGLYDAEVSGLAGGGGQLSPARMPMYVGSGTDEVRIVRARREMPETQNRAGLGGRPVNPQAYAETLAVGFEAGYRIILEHRDELLSAEGLITAFRDDEVRFIPRPTMTYARVQGESWHPDLLRDSLDREIFSEVISLAFVDFPDRDLILASEQRQLADQDIPSFYTTPGSQDLYDRYGAVARDFLEFSGLEAVRTRIAKLSEEDLRRQLWCIRASMSGLTVGTLPSSRAEPRYLPEAPLGPDLAVRAASSIADRLLDAALAGDDEPPSWLSVNFIGDRFWTVGHAGIDLYSGVPGVALFLAQLGASSGDPRFRHPAEQIAQQLVDVTDQLAAGGERSVPLPIGGFGEIGGLVYVLGQLGELWREPSLTDAARKAAALCRARFADDTVLDVIGGTAGAALAILDLHRAAPDDLTLDTIQVAGGTLADRAVRLPAGVGWYTDFEKAEPLLGFAHGASGIGYTLARIAEVTGDGRLDELCGGALHLERHHLSPERGNWPDLRSISQEGTFMNAWCHGAAGIGLARAAMLRLAGLEPWRNLIRDDLEIAVGRVRADLVVDGRYVGIGNDSICHGDLGLVETLLAAGTALADPELSLLGRRCAQAIAEQVLAGVPRPGVPQGVTTPGLLMGLAGIGYGLLRAAMPDRVPNVLMLGTADSDGAVRPGQVTEQREVVLLSRRTG